MGLHFRTLYNRLGSDTVWYSLRSNGGGCSVSEEDYEKIQLLSSKFPCPSKAQSLPLGDRAAVRPAVRLKDWTSKAGLFASQVRAIANDSKAASVNETHAHSRVLHLLKRPKSPP